MEELDNLTVDPPENSFNLQKKNSKIFLFVIITVILVVISIFALYKVNSPGEKLEEASSKSTKIALNDKNSDLFYSFTPDGSGIIYIDVVRDYDGYYGIIKNTYFYLDFKSGKQEKIYSVDFPQDNKEEVPFIYWLDRNISILGGQIYLGPCRSEDQTGTIVFNVVNKQKKLVNCINRGRTEDGDIYRQSFLRFYNDYSRNKKRYKIYKVDYSTQYSSASYILTTQNSYYLFGNYIDNRVYPEEKKLYEELNLKVNNILFNERINNSQIYNKKIYSRDKQFYFVFENINDKFCQLIGMFAIADCLQDQYIKVYNSNDKLLKKISIGKKGMWIKQPTQIGYVDYWSDDNKIVLINYAEGNNFKVYFIDFKN